MNNVRTTPNHGTLEAIQQAGLKPTERLFIEKTLMRMYPRLQRYDLAPWTWFNGPLIPDFIVQNTDSDIRRIVEIGCGDGVFSNILALLFPDIEIIGIDTDPHKIADARSTVSYRQNLKFICGNAATMVDIPCDRIIYNGCLGRLQNIFAFKKLLVKTSRWLVADGDFIVKESPLKLLSKPHIFQELWPMLRRNHDFAACIRTILAEVGYPNPIMRQGQGLFGFPTETFHRSSRQLTLSGLSMPSSQLSRQQAKAVAEWQGHEPDESTHSVLGFLFSERETDFSMELV